MARWHWVRRRHVSLKRDRTGGTCARDLPPDHAGSTRAARRHDDGAIEVLQFHRTIPDSVRIGHYDPGGSEIVDELVIEPSSGFSLDAINSLSALVALKFVLGNATSIGAIETLPALSDLSFLQVRYLEDLGNLERFPRLTALDEQSAKDQ